jgi:hypothetical protein
MLRCAQSILVPPSTQPLPTSSSWYQIHSQSKINTDTRLSSSFALVFSFLQSKLKPFVSHFVYLSFISASLSLSFSHLPGLLNMMTGEHELSVRHSEDSSTLLLTGIMGPKVPLTNTCKFEANFHLRERIKLCWDVQYTVLYPKPKFRFS